jgi:hypothetical protein
MAADLRQVIAVLNERVKPAVLHQTDTTNSSLIVLWLRKGQEAGTINSESSVGEIANYLYACVVRDANITRQLVWSVPPKLFNAGKYTPPPSNTPNTLQTVEDGKRITKIHEGAAEKEALLKKHEAEKKRAMLLLDNFDPISFRGRELRIQEEVRQWGHALIAKGGDMTTIANQIFERTQREYRKIETRASGTTREDRMR